MKTFKETECFKNRTDAFTGEQIPNILYFPEYLLTILILLGKKKYNTQILDVATYKSHPNFTLHNL